MPKANLGALLGNLPTAEPPRPPAEPPRPRAEAVAPASPESPAAPEERAPRGSMGEPLYLSLVRKDTRIRSDQLEALTVHARRLNRLKPPGPRITENTLIRIAIDLLLARVEQASGSTEDELRGSLR